MSVLSDLLFPDEKRSNWVVDDDDLFEGKLTAANVRVNRERGMELSTVWACVRLLTNTIATLPVDLVISIGQARFPERSNRPGWMVAPDPINPAMSLQEHFAQVTTSLLLDGNFFTLARPSIMDPFSLHVLDPRRVEIKADSRGVPVYEVYDEKGKLIGTAGPMEMLHGVWIRMPGALRGLNPIQAARQAIGLGITAEEFGARFFGQGTTLSYGVEVPGPMTDQQREDLRANLKKRHAGTQNAHSVSVLTNGAKFVAGLGVSNEDSQFLETRKFTRDQIASEIYGIPPHMVGSTEPGASSYNSVEQRSLEFRQYAVSPLVSRIETAYGRLVEVPDTIRSPGATAAIKFNLNAVVRADIQARFEAYGKGILAGVLKPDEARGWEDLPPVPGGNITYMQQQMVPLGTTVGTAVAGAA